MLSNAIPVFLCCLFFSVPVFACETDGFPCLVGDAETQFFDEAGQPIDKYFTWAGWRFSDDARDRKNWTIINDWVGMEKSRQTALMRQKVAALIGTNDFTLSEGVSCYTNLTCLYFETGVKLGLHYNDHETLEREVGIASEMFLTYKAAINNAMVDLPDFGEQNGAYENNFGQRLFSDQMWRRAVDLFFPTHIHIAEDTIKTLRAYYWSVSDLENATFLEQFAAQHGWPVEGLVGAKIAGRIWLLVQHADRAPDFQISSLKRMEALLEQQMGVRDEMKWQYAYLYDRVQRALDRPQRYGTQLECREGHFFSQRLEDEEQLDNWRAEMGMEPVADYIAMFPTPC